MLNSYMCHVTITFNVYLILGIWRKWLQLGVSCWKIDERCQNLSGSNQPSLTFAKFMFFSIMTANFYAYLSLMGGQIQGPMV